MKTLNLVGCRFPTRSGGHDNSEEQGEGCVRGM
jgi:hypothetical protein